MELLALLPQPLFHTQTWLQVEKARQKRWGATIEPRRPGTPRNREVCPGKRPGKAQPFPGELISHTDPSC